MCMSVVYLFVYVCVCVCMWCGCSCAVITATLMEQYTACPSSVQFVCCASAFSTLPIAISGRANS